jgi:hypothetical protein
VKPTEKEKKRIVPEGDERTFKLFAFWFVPFRDDAFLWLFRGLSPTAMYVNPLRGCLSRTLGKSSPFFHHAFA